MLHLLQGLLLQEGFSPPTPCASGMGLPPGQTGRKASDLLNCASGFPLGLCPALEHYRFAPGGATAAAVGIRFSLLRAPRACPCVCFPVNEPVKCVGSTAPGATVPLSVPLLQGLLLQWRALLSRGAPRLLPSSLLVHESFGPSALRLLRMTAAAARTSILKFVDVNLVELLILRCRCSMEDGKRL